MPKAYPYILHLQKCTIHRIYYTIFYSIVKKKAKKRLSFGGGYAIMKTDFLEVNTK